MKKSKKHENDPRTETPPGYFLEHTDWLPENTPSTSFFSMKDTLFFAFLIASCLIVGAVLWLNPPKYITFDNNLNKLYDPAIAAKNLPKSLRIQPSYDQKRFEEIPDDDPDITGDETDLPLKESEPDNLPPTIKSDIKKVIDFILASLHIPRLS